MRIESQQQQRSSLEASSGITPLNNKSGHHSARTGNKREGPSGCKEEGREAEGQGVGRAGQL